jgi:threonine synthase
VSPSLVPAPAPAIRSTVLGLKCRECGKEYEKAPVHVCELCFGPLEVAYDYDAAKKQLSREIIARRPTSMWRYSELLPLDGPPKVGSQVGWTPLVKADRLAKKLGVRELYVKNDAVSYPSLSFKDRVVAIALSKAIEFGYDTVACASTGNLANSVAANAAAAGLKAFVFIPHDLEATKVVGTTIYGATVVGIAGTYDEVNRLCSEIAGKYKWGFANINLRPFYAEGSKSYAYEIVEQMGWRMTDHIVAPMAGGSLIVKIRKAFQEFDKLGLTDNLSATRIHGAQAAGCAPIVEAVRAGRELIKPVKQPRGVAKSLAIGNPADGFYAVRAIKESGGHGAMPDDAEIIAAMRLLAETEGIFTETAGGVTLAATQTLIAEGHIKPEDSVTICVTGQGLKTTDSVVPLLPVPRVIPAKLSEFDKIVDQ